MTLPSGTIALSQVNTELDISPSSTTINMGATAVRTLAGEPSGSNSQCLIYKAPKGVKCIICYSNWWNCYYIQVF